MKKFKLLISLLLAAVLLFSFGTVSVFAAEENDLSKIELSKPQVPNYFVFDPGEGDQSDGLRMFFVLNEDASALASEFYADSGAFYEKYGLYEFTIVLQYDVSLDGDSDWQHEPLWDEDYNIGSPGEICQHVSIGSERMDSFSLFDLYHYDPDDDDSFAAYRPAIITKHFKDGDYECDTYHFDTENHSLHIRYRVYMEWRDYDKATDTLGERESKFSEWSDVAVFGKGSTQIIPEKPTGYEAPVISDLKYTPPENENWNGTLSYIQQTPESIWLAGMYYEMTDDGDLEGLETQVSIDGGEWVQFDTANSWGDWSLWNGERHAIHHEEYKIIPEDSHVKLRIRFNGTEGPGEWSNVLELNGGGEGATGTDLSGDTENKNRLRINAPFVASA